MRGLITVEGVGQVMEFWENVKKDLNKAWDEGISAVKDGSRFAARKVDQLTQEGKRLYKGAFMPIMRSRLYDLADGVDNIFDSIRDTANTFIYLKDKKFPSKVKDIYRKMVAEACKGITVFEKVVRGFFEGAKDLEAKIKKANVHEHNLDVLKKEVFDDERISQAILEFSKKFTGFSLYLFCTLNFIHKLLFPIAKHFVVLLRMTGCTSVTRCSSHIVPPVYSLLEMASHTVDIDVIHQVGNTGDFIINGNNPMTMDPVLILSIQPPLSAAEMEIKESCTGGVGSGSGGVQYPGGMPVVGGTWFPVAMGAELIAHGSGPKEICLRFRTAA